MIKIIIKEQATKAGIASAGTQAIRSYYNPKQAKTKAKTKEETPVTDTTPQQPAQQTASNDTAQQEEPVQTQSAQEIKLEQSYNNLEKIINNLYYTHFSGLNNTNYYDLYYSPHTDVHSPFEEITKSSQVYKDKNFYQMILSSMLVDEFRNDREEIKRDKVGDVKELPDSFKQTFLNSLRNNKEQILTNARETLKIQPQTATPVPLEPEDAPTEQAATTVTVQEVSDEIDYLKLFNNVNNYSDFKEQDNVIQFVDKIVKFLKSNDNFNSIYNEIQKQIEDLSLSIFNDQRKQQRLKAFFDNLADVAGMYESKRPAAGLVTEVMDPVTGLSILLGTISLGTLIGGLNYKRLRAKSNETPEGRYLFLLGLEVKLLIIKNFIDGNNSTNIKSLIIDKVKPNLEEFKKPSLNFFKQKNLLKEKARQLEGLAESVALLIREKSNEQTPVQLDESTINRWKLLAGIKG